MGVDNRFLENISSLWSQICHIDRYRDSQMAPKLLGGMDVGTGLTLEL